MVFEKYEQIDKTMDSRQIERIKHYCNRLGLDSMDRRDVITWLTFDRNSTNPKEREAFSKAHSHILQLEHLHMVRRFNEYLKEEDELFHDYQMSFRGISDDEIWNKVYDTIDKTISLDIEKAKYISKHDVQFHNEKVRWQNRGCIASIYIVAIIIAILLLTKC